MRVKTFYAKGRESLEKQMNEWLEKNPVSPDSIKVQYQVIGFEDEVQYIGEHFVLLFYVPMMPIR